MTTNDRRANPAASEDPPVLTWTVHLARTQPEKFAVIIPVFLIASLCAYFMAGPIGVLVVLVALTTSLSDFIFPVHYIVTAQRATCRRLMGVTEIEWKRVRRCYVDEFGVKLSPLPRPSRLEAYRGVYLRFDSNKDQVIDTVQSLRANTC